MSATSRHVCLWNVNSDLLTQAWREQYRGPVTCDQKLWRDTSEEWQFENGGRLTYRMKGWRRMGKDGAQMDIKRPEET